MASIEALNKTMTEEVAKFNQLQNDLRGVHNSRQQLDAQLNENINVKEELDLCDSDARVFKLIGPALMQQNLKEAKENVNNRIKYITDEIKRQEETIKDIEKKMELHREAINGINREKALRQKSGGSSVQSAS